MTPAEKQNGMALFLRTPAMWRACAIAMLALPLAANAAGSAGEFSVKAAVVHKIAKFVTWPTDTFATRRSPIRFCVAGDSPVLAELEKLQKHPIHGRSLIVSAAPAPAATAANCDILYLGQVESRQATDWLLAVMDSPVLTVGESPALRANNSIVTITIRRSKVRFAINLKASTRAGLNIAGQLLQLAAVVDTGSVEK